MAYLGTSDDGRPPIIVCGLHSVGLRAIEQLRIAGEPVVVVDDTPDYRLLPVVAELGARHLDLNASWASSLEEAGIMTASALLCTAESDLENLEVALLARRLRPDLRIVVQIGNDAVGRGVAAITGPTRVLDVATIAAPTLAEACLDQRNRRIDIAGRPFTLQELVADRASTVRALYHDLAPIAVVPADGRAMLVCPGRDEKVRPGDRVVLLGEVEDLPLDLGSTGPRRLRGADRVREVRRYVRGFVAETDRAMRATLGALLALGLLSVLVLSVGYERPHGPRLGVLDAVYFTTETLTTVGFGDLSFASQSSWLRTWSVVLMIVGFTLVTVLYAMLTNLLVGRRIAQSLGRQLATRMTDHVVVIGLGSVGLRVLEYLVRGGHPVVVLERDEDNRFLVRARALGVPVVFGDATVPATLDAAGLHRARAVAIVTSNYLANIETGLTAVDLLGPRRDEVPIVMRVFDRDIARTIEEGLGFHSVRSTAALAAPWFVGAALGLDIVHTFFVDQQPMLIGHLTVTAEGGLHGTPMSQLSARIRVVAIHRTSTGEGDGSFEYGPRRDSRFTGGDEAYLVGPYVELISVLRRNAVAT